MMGYIFGVDEKSSQVLVVESFDGKKNDVPAHLKLAPKGVTPKIGQVWDGSKFADFVTPTISEINAIVDIENAVETRRQELSSPLAAKRDHYNLIADLAQQALTDPSALALLDSEAAARGMVPEDLRDLVIVKAGLWQQADQALAALEAAGRNAVEAATPDTIQDVLNGYLSQIESVGTQ